MERLKETPIDILLGLRCLATRTCREETGNCGIGYMETIENKVVCKWVELA